jgi:hypothetical protein
MSGPTTVRICSAILTGGPPPCSPGMLLMVVYLLASRAWRALPPVRQRLAARWSHTPATDDTLTSGRPGGMPEDRRTEAPCRYCCC